MGHIFTVEMNCTTLIYSRNYWKTAKCSTVCLESYVLYSHLQRGSSYSPILCKYQKFTLFKYRRGRSPEELLAIVR
jgi:hypothetical protein